MKRFILAWCCFCILLLCGCGERFTAARTLPDVRILDEAPLSAEATSPPAPVRTANAARSPENTERPSPSPSPKTTPIPDPTPDPALCPYVGSRNSEVYHLPDCAQALRIKSENLVGWECAELAEAAGRTPCRVCLSEKPEKTPKPTATPGQKAEAPPPERSSTDRYPYVGSRNSEIYHLAGCPQAARIRPENQVGWESAELAEAAGRTLCEICRSGNTPEPTLTPTETPPPVATPEASLDPQPEGKVAPGAYAYVGSRNSEIYHLAGCSQAERIRPENLVGWESAEAAEAAGRTPCKVCLPGQAEEATSTPEPILEPQPEEWADGGEHAYVGSRNSDKYHLPDCRYAKNIDEENRIYWADREEAEADGYEACGVCKP